MRETPHSVNDIAELVAYHLVASAPDDDAAHVNLVQLELLAPRPLCREATWVFCDRCGCSVDSDLIHPDGHHYADDGDCSAPTAGICPDESAQSASTSGAMPMVNRGGTRTGSNVAGFVMPSSASLVESPSHVPSNSSSRAQLGKAFSTFVCR